MVALNNFDPNQHDDPGSLVIPAGWYPLVITSEKPKRAGDNAKVPNRPMLELEMDVFEGEYKGRKQWLTLMMKEFDNGVVGFDEDLPSGARAFSSICRAVGRLQVSDTTQVHGIPFMAKVKVGKDNKGNDRNEVALEFKPYNALPNGQGGTGATTPPASGAGDSGGGRTGPWGQTAA